MREYEDDRDGTERITVSLPKGTAAILRALVDAGQAPSVSKLLAEAIAPVVRAQRDRQRTLDALMERRGGRPIDPEALAYWRDKLTADHESDSGQESGAA